jgi:hypothetical protein
VGWGERVKKGESNSERESQPGGGRERGRGSWREITKNNMQRELPINNARWNAYRIYSEFQMIT